MLKNNLSILLGLLLSINFLYAQEETSDQKYTEISLNANALLHQVLNFGNQEDINNPYLFNVNFGKDNNRFIRLGLGLNFKSETVKDDFSNGFENRDIIVDFRLGYFKKYEFKTKWSSFFGGDIILGYEETSSSIGAFLGDIEQFNREIGLGPVVGICYHFNDKMSLWTESSLYWTYNNRTEHTNFGDFGGGAETTNSDIFVTEIIAPIAIFFSFKF